VIEFVKHHILLVSSLFIAVVLGIGVWFSLQKVEIEYVNPKFGDITESIYGLGKVKTDEVYDVKIAIIKTVKKLYVREGDEVKRGQMLVELEDNLRFAAPFDGVVSYIAFHEAQSVFPQQTLLRLEGMSGKYIEVSLEQQGALRVQKGQSVRILFESIRGEQLHGTVSALFSRNEEFLAHIHVDNLSKNVLPGMTADVAIEVGKKNNTLLVPLAAVSDGRVKVLRNGKKQTVTVSIGGVDGNWAEVTEGDLQQSDQIIVKRR